MGRHFEFRTLLWKPRLTRRTGRSTFYAHFQDSKSHGPSSFSHQSCLFLAFTILTKKQFLGFYWLKVWEPLHSIWPEVWVLYLGRCFRGRQVQQAAVGSSLVIPRRSAFQSAGPGMTLGSAVRRYHRGPEWQTTPPVFCPCSNRSEVNYSLATFSICTSMHIYAYLCISMQMYISDMYSVCKRLKKYPQHVRYAPQVLHYIHFHMVFAGFF